jgi:hypothetical protein
MDRSLEGRPSHRVEWLDAPPPPDDAALEELREVLREHHQVGEAWLVRQLITPAEGDAHEVTAVALTVDSATDAPSRASIELVAELSRATNQALNVHNWIFVNDNIRAKTEQHGLKIYSRS